MNDTTASTHPENTRLIQQLQAALGADSVRAGADISAKYQADWSGEASAQPSILVLPRDTNAVSKALQLCHAAGQPVVPQGGLTGLAGGAIPTGGAVALSLERMHGIDELDADSATVTAWAGTPLHTLQAAATEAGFLCGLDLGARGSCQIGGNIATNAGGNRVIRYGMARDQILGLEVVLADGTVLPMLNKMTKNNTGPDLKQLFIGSEGTLGVVTRAVFQLHPAIAGANTALLALTGFDAALKLLHHTRQQLSGLVSAFEVIWNDYYAVATSQLGASAPLDSGQPLYVLMDLQSARPDEHAARFESVLEHAMAQGWVVDAAIAQSNAHAAAFWQLRDGVGDILQQLAPTINFDVSVPIAQIGRCVQRMRTAMNTDFPDVQHLYFGHIGDGNVHIIAGPLPDDQGQTEHAIEKAFYSIVRDLDGSVSAEHGIGLHKRPWLEYSRSPAELQLIQTLKQALDPAGILNPGKIIEQ